MSELEQYRSEIDEIDGKLLELLGRRKDVVTKVGEYKRKHSLQVFDPKREEYLHNYYKELSEKYNLSFDFVIQLFEMIIVESRRTQGMK